MLKDLITANRSYRWFDQNVPTDEATLRQLVDLARLAEERKQDYFRKKKK